MEKRNAAAVVDDPNGVRCMVGTRDHKPIYHVPAQVADKKISMMEYLLQKSEGAGGESAVIKEVRDWLIAKAGGDATKEMAEPSQQGVTLGRKFQPFNMRGLQEFQSSNPHHSACIQTKKYSTVGLGFRAHGELPGRVGTITDASLLETVTQQNQPQAAPQTAAAPNPQAPPDPSLISQTLAQHQVMTKADKILNPLCTHTFQDVLLLVAEDYHQVGNAGIEVVRAAGDGKITGLHHIPAADMFPWIEDYQYNFHYEVLGLEGNGGARHFARWGDSAAFMKRNGTGLGAWFNMTSGFVNPGMVSEVISFKNPSSRSRWYGFPDWLSCVSSIELLQCLHQYKYDFFLNRGVPEFIMLLTGAKLADADWKVVLASLAGNIGLGNSHKTVALNIPNENVKMTLEKLAMDGGSGESQAFGNDKDVLALDIVSAHRVPPLLAGIQIPGKLGANNELPNALMAFQVLVIGPTQRKFQQTLGMTLGNKDQNGGLDLAPEDFLFRTITEEIDIGTLDTQARMRTPVTQAKAQGRDMGAGLKS